MTEQTPSTDTTIPVADQTTQQETQKPRFPRAEAAIKALNAAAASDPYNSTEATIQRAKIDKQNNR